MSGSSFSAQVNSWVRATEERTLAVFHDAAQTVANEVRRPKGDGGNLPVDLGNLRRSLMASTEAMPLIKPNQERFGNNDGQIALSIDGSKLGDTIYLGFQAIYARRVNYGFVGKDSLGRSYNQAGANFVGLTAQRWPQIVQTSAFKIQKAVQTRALGGARGTVARQDAEG